MISLNEKCMKSWWFGQSYFPWKKTPDYYDTWQRVNAMYFQLWIKATGTTMQLPLLRVKRKQSCLGIESPFELNENSYKEVLSLCDPCRAKANTKVRCEDWMQIGKRTYHSHFLACSYWETKVFIVFVLLFTSRNYICISHCLGLWIAQGLPRPILPHREYWQISFLFWHLTT